MNRSGLPSVIMSLPNSLASTTRVRFSNPLSARSRTSCAIGASISRFRARHALVAIDMSVPALEGNVFGCDLDEAHARFHQTARHRDILARICRCYKRRSWPSAQAKYRTPLPTAIRAGGAPSRQIAGATPDGNRCRPPARDCSSSSSGSSRDGGENAARPSIFRPRPRRPPSRGPQS